ncbi:MAG: hypothetical protein ABI728_06805 [Betaproteobacteria bacterium]
MIRILTISILLLLPLLARAEGYTCIEDMATGFAYRNGQWQETSFKPGAKFIIRPASEFDQDTGMSIALGIPRAKWAVGRPGEYEPIAGCEFDFDDEGNLDCRASYFSKFRMNRKSLRFLHAFLAGYSHPDSGNEADDSPYIAIGKCSPM